MLWWKIYFWLSAVLLVLGVSGYTMYPHLSARDFVDIGMCVLDMLGLYAYIWRKKLFTPDMWQWYFWLNIALVAFDLLYIYTNSIPLPAVLLSKSIEQNRSDYIPAILISLPFFYAIYKLGYGHITTKAAIKPKSPKRKK